jgi:hypothetical protein
MTPTFKVLMNEALPGNESGNILFVRETHLLRVLNDNGEMEVFFQKSISNN